MLTTMFNSSRVQYRKDYLNPDGGIVYSEEVGAYQIADHEPAHAIVVTKQFYTRQAKDAYRPDGEKSLAPSVVSSGSTLIVIKSRAVIHALRTVVGYYPDTRFTGDSVSIEEPFPVLYHYRRELQEYAEQFAHQAEDCREDHHVAEDIVTLLSLFDEMCGQDVQEELARYKLDTPTCTHDMLWMLFKPGTDVYSDRGEDSTFAAYVVRDVSFTYIDRKASAYDIRHWNISYNALYVGAAEPIVTTIEPFAGEKAIGDLRLFPCAYMSTEKHGTTHDERYKQFVKRGEMFFNLLKGPQYASFDGFTADWPPTPQRGRVMVDVHQFRLEFGGEEDLATDVEMSNVIAARCLCSHCTDASLKWSQTRIQFAGYSKINPLKVSVLPEHHRFLAVRGIWSYLLKQRSWSKVHNCHLCKPLRCKL